MLRDVMFKLAHLSDIHLPPLPVPHVTDLFNKRILGFINWHINRKRHHLGPILDALIDDVKAQAPDHIAITGDLTNLGLELEFQETREWLKSLGTPEEITIIPGNHDIYVHEGLRLSSLYWDHYMRSNIEGSNYSASYEARFPFVRCFGKVALVGLSSAIPMPAFVAAGELGGSQLSTLARTLNDLGAEEYFRVVLIHHPPLPDVVKESRALRDSEQLKDVLMNEGADLVLFGHNHTRMKLDLKGHTNQIPLIEAPSSSLGPSEHHAMAGYNIFHIEGKNGTWSVEMSHRGLESMDGEVSEIERTVLRSP